jgi:rare lipoprotein A
MNLNTNLNTKTQQNLTSHLTFKTKQFLPFFQPSRAAVVLTVVALAVVIPVSAVVVRAAEFSRRSIPATPTHGPDVAALSVATAPAGPALAQVVHKPSRIHMMAGNASWYGAVLQGHRTASGAIFDENQLTAAHRTLPFGTMVRVTDLRTRRNVVVKITDRGVLNSDRAIDLSRAAAEQLGMVRDGVHPVRLQVIPKNDPSLRSPNSDETASLRTSSQSKVD